MGGHGETWVVPLESQGVQWMRCWKNVAEQTARSQLIYTYAVWYPHKELTVCHLTSIDDIGCGHSLLGWQWPSMKTGDSTPLIPEPPLPFMSQSIIGQRLLTVSITIIMSTSGMANRSLPASSSIILGDYLLLLTIISGCNPYKPHEKHLY